MLTRYWVGFVLAIFWAQPKSDAMQSSAASIHFCIDENKNVSRRSVASVALRCWGRISPFAQTTLYKAVEERVLLVPKGPMSQRYTRVPLSRFTIVLATNHPSGINAPLRERMSHILHFEFYSVEELGAICRQRATAMRWSVAPEVCDLIAVKAKQTPRLAIRLLQSCWRTARAEGAETVTAQHFRRTLALEGLDAELGLDKAEQVYLRALAESEGRARLHLLATRVGQPSRTISEVTESFLIRRGLVTRTASGRELTEKGWEYVRRNFLPDANRQ